jgi:hypothetical protein
MNMVSKLSEEQRKRLSFIEETAIMYNGNYKLEMVHLINAEVYSKLEKLFTTSVGVDDVKPKMKAYVIGNGSLKMSDIKEICKKRELKITTDINNADIIISNTSLTSTYTTTAGWFPTKAILHKPHASVYHIQDMNNKYREDLKQWLNGKAESISNFDDYAKLIIPQDKTGYQDFTYEEMRRAMWFITDEGLELLYHILAKKIPIVVDTNLFQSIEKVTMDSDMYDMIKMMIRSTDDDRIIAMQMLYNCNIDKSAYHLWKLMKEDGSRILYCRNRNTKIHKSFIEATHRIRHISDSDAVNEFYEMGCLTEDIYNEFVEKTRKDIMRELNYYSNSLFNISVSSLTYEEYLQLKEVVNA